MTRSLVPFIDGQGKAHSYFFVDSVSKILYFKKDHAGRRIKFSTGLKEDQFIAAKRFANQEFTRRISEKKNVARSLISDELELWLKVKASEGHAYDTMNNIKRAARELIPYWGDKFPHEITRDNLAEWYEFWRVANPHKQMENAIKYLRNFCRYLSEKTFNGRALLPTVPKITDPNHKKIRRDRKKKKEFILSNSDLKQILKTAETDRERLIVLFMYTMATRITETLELRFGQEIQLDHVPPIYRWSDGQNKAGLDGFHALHPILMPYLNKMGLGPGRLFPQLGDPTKALREQQINWDSWRKRAALSHHWTPHTFRHSCLSNLFNDPKNPQALICILYRVSLAVAMETYIKPTEAGRELMKEAVRVNL